MQKTIIASIKYGMHTSRKVPEQGTTTEEYAYEPLFKRIVDLTQRADALENDSPDNIRIGINGLVRDVVGFCREHPEFRYALPPFANQPEWRNEWQKFIALLEITRGVAQQARAAIKSAFGFDSPRPLSERGILQGLLAQFGSPIRPEDIPIDDKYLTRQREDPTLTQRLPELRDLRNALAPHNLQVGINVPGGRWFDPHFGITSATVNLAHYDPSESTKLPQLDPLATTAVKPPRRDLPPREIERARIARHEALQRAIRNEKPQRAEDWVPNRNKLLDAINRIDEFSEDQLKELGTACERFMRRTDLTFRRTQKKEWRPERLAETLETILSNIPKQITRLPAWRRIKDILTELHLLCDYITAGYYDQDALTDEAYDRLSRHLPDKQQASHEARMANVRRHKDSEDSKDREDRKDREMDLTELMDSAPWTPSEDRQDGLQRAPRIEEWTYEDLGDLREANFSKERTLINRNNRPRLSEKLLSYAARHLIRNGILPEEIIEIINNPDMDQRSRVALQLFLLHLSQETARCQVADWQQPIRMPLIPGKPVVDLLGFKTTVENEKLPKSTWRQQKEAMVAVKRGMEGEKSKMYICAPPGTGKTRDAILLMQYLNPEGRTLILVPTIQLMRQTKEAIRKESKFKDIGKVGGGSAQFDRDVTIATYASYQKAALQGFFHPSEFALVVMDEAHRSLSDMRSRIADTFREAIIVGMTASDNDIHGAKVSREFGCVYKLGTTDGMRAGIVNPTRLWRDECSDDMHTKVRKFENIHSHRLKGERTLGIFDTIERVEYAAKFLKKTGIDARCVHSQMDPDEAEVNDNTFRNGEFPVLLVCDMLLEGWDDPGLQHIIMADLRTATWQFQQATGRNGRKLPDKGTSTLSILGKADSDATNYVLEKAFGINPHEHIDGDLIITPDGQWPDNTILT